MLQKNSFTPITFLLPKFLPPVFAQPTNQLPLPTEATHRSYSTSPSQPLFDLGVDKWSYRKKKRGVLVGKKFQKSTICSIFDICISHLKFFLFGKKNILFKSTFVKRRGIFDHSSQDGILWHAKKVTNIINCIRFVASTFCITQGWEVCEKPKIHWRSKDNLSILQPSSKKRDLNHCLHPIRSRNAVNGSEMNRCKYIEV